MPEQMLFMYVIHLPWRPPGAGLRPVKNQDTGAITWKDVVLIHTFAALAHICKSQHYSGENPRIILVSKQFRRSLPPEYLV